MRAFPFPLTSLDPGCCFRSNVLEMNCVKRKRDGDCKVSVIKIELLGGSKVVDLEALLRKSTDRDMLNERVKVKREKVVGFSELT